MPAYIDDSAQRLEDLLDREEPRIARIFYLAIEELKGEVDLDEIADLLEAGRTDEALERLVYVAQSLGTASNVTFVTAGQSAAEFLAHSGVARIVFDQVNSSAVAAMQASRLELISEFTDEQRRATSIALISGIEAGLGPREQARQFRDSIGLTERQWAAVETYRRSLESIGTDEQQTIAALTHATRDRRGDAQIRRAVRENQPLPPDKIEWLVQRKIAMAIRKRSEVIGRTEAMRAVNQGNEEMYRQAIAAGLIDADKLRRTWVTRLDGRERETHHLLNGQVRRWGEVWITRNGQLRFPGDPEAPAEEVIQCRCVLATRIQQR